jgi:GNAT superfamily N-acetyltransferase
VPADLEIRPATLDDLPTIVEMLARDSMTSQSSSPTPGQFKAFEEITAHPDNELIVATLDGQIVATLQLTFIPGLSNDGAWRAQFEAVRVRADLRNQRIGTRLIEWVIERARTRGCRIVQLTSNIARVDARRFYERLGFIASHTGMKLSLSRPNEPVHATSA